MDFLFNAEVFSEFRPIFIVLLAFLTLFFFISLIPKERDTKISFFTVLIVSITHATIAGTLLVTENWFLEEFSLDGDQVTFLLFLGVILLAVLNPIIYKLRNRNSRKSSYRFR